MANGAADGLDRHRRHGCCVDIELIYLFVLFPLFGTEESPRAADQIQQIANAETMHEKEGLREKGWCQISETNHNVFSGLILPIDGGLPHGSEQPIAIISTPNYSSRVKGYS